MVTNIRLERWQNEFKAMPDNELRLLAVSGQVRSRRLEILKLEIQERDRVAGEVDKAVDIDIAREANRLAEKANEKANTANAIAIIAAIIAIIATAISIASAIYQTS